MAVINTLVEGLTDEAAANRIIKAAGHVPGTCYGKNGCGYIRKKVQAFNRSAKSIYYLTLVDFMDTDEFCSPEVVAKWVPYRERRMLFRVVINELESWLLADREGIAKFLKVDQLKISVTPEKLPDPKLELVKLARKSQSKQIRSSIAPEPGSKSPVGKLYTSEIIRFINTKWDIQVARINAPSLDKCLRRLGEIA